MLRMLPTDGIHDALFPAHILFIRVIQMRYRLRCIHHRSHLLRLVVTIHPSFLQSVNPLHQHIVWCHAHVFEVREPSLINKFLYRPRLQQHVEQVRKSRPIQSAWRCRQSQEFRLRPLLPQHPIRLRHRMMSLIHDHQLRLPSGTVPCVSSIANYTGTVPKMRIKFLYRLYPHPLLR